MWTVLNVLPMTQQEKASGAPLEPQLAALGFHWATVMINIFYLPYAVDFSPAANVQGMVDRLWAAEQQLNQLV